MENNGLNHEMSTKRLQLEKEWEDIMGAEEIYWQQRGGEKWILEGDSISNFFHLVANGRRRKKKILSLEHEGETLNDPTQVPSVIYAYYKNLFGIQPPRTVRLAEGVWEDRGRLNPSDIDDLLRPFTEEEDKNVVFGMKENMASGPDGFSVTFYKQCWKIVKGDLMRMIHDFYMGDWTSTD